MDNRTAVIFDYSGENNEPHLVDNGVHFFLRTSPFYNTDASAQIPKICIGVIGGQSSSQILYALCDETHLKISRFYAVLSAEKNAAVPVTRCRELHKRGCISKTISKNFLDKFLDTAMLCGIRVFGGSNIKNAENPCKHWDFSVFYRLISSSKIL